MFLKSHKQAREEMLKAQNPLILYDNDADGFCSFALIRRMLGRGEGNAVKSYPDLSEQYLTKIDYMHADSAIVLDIHSISDRFREGMRERGLPIIWIDHHIVADTKMQKESDLILYFNPLYTVSKGKNSDPTSLQAYKISMREEDDWIALVGCIADCHLPRFAGKVAKEHPAMWSKGVKTAFDAYYRTDIGRIALMINFVIKDIPSKVIEAQEFMVNCRSPIEALAEDSPMMKETAAALYKKYIDLVAIGEKDAKDESIFFIYSGTVSMSSEISNALAYRYPKKHVAVAYRRQGIINISIRGKHAKKVLDRILPKIPNSTGGGHEKAVGARIPSSSLMEFEKLFREECASLKG